MNKKYSVFSDDIVLYDRFLLWLILGLLFVGFIMVSSTSISTGIRLTNDPCYFIKRMIIYYIIALSFFLVVLKTSITVWKNYSTLMLLCSFIMLIIVLLNNYSVNGATRWITWGSVCIQPTEFAKLSFICYLASYLVRKSKEVCSTFWGLFKPIVVVMILVILLLLQPDFGSSIILFVVTLSLLFLFGAKIWQLFFIININIILIILTILSQPYRVKRIFSFLNPWKDPFGTGYQLTQSFIAFGRGKFFGQGLGNSVQKLEYLPEAHTDFIFSILAEELGYCGVFIVLVMLFSVSLRGMFIGYKALNVNQKFSGILSCSIGIWIGLQVFINIGTISGILPTKGLTLPFISYGGSSFLVMLISVAILLRIDFETRLIKNQAFTCEKI